MEKKDEGRQDRAIREYLNLLLQSEEGMTVDEIVRRIGEYFDADRAYIFEQDEAGEHISNTYEWCKEGVSQEINYLQRIPKDYLKPWFDEFKKKGSFYISCDDEYAQKEPIVYEILEPQNISSLIAAPFLRGSNIVGFMGVDNPRKHVTQELFLSVAAATTYHEICLMKEAEKDRKQQEMLQNALKEAENANASKTMFLNNMSHDIRTPMNAILGFAKLMEKKVDNPEAIKDYLSKIEDSGSYLLSIINNVLDMARIESGKMDLDLIPTDIGKEAATILTLFTNDVARRHLKLTFNQELKHEFVFADGPKLQQILVNLISNSVKYTPDGGSIHLEIKEATCEKEDYTTIVATVSDTGIGMSEEFMNHIFESFARERTSTEGNAIGTGLGMSIVKRLVDMMEGSIVVESKVGQGSKFIISCDFKIAESQHHKLNQEKKETERRRSNRILLAEDNDLNAEIAMEILQEEGIQVDRAEDGAVCVELLTKAAPEYYDLILMDIQMPNMNGYEATKIIRGLEDEAKSNVPIVAMTANAFDEDKKKAFEVGMNEHLAKPISVSKLMEMLDSIL